jgi:hypothetical protein
VLTWPGLLIPCTPFKTARGPQEKIRSKDDFSNSSATRSRIVPLMPLVPSSVTIFTVPYSIKASGRKIPDSLRPPMRIISSHPRSASSEARKRRGATPTPAPTTNPLLPGSEQLNPRPRGPKRDTGSPLFLWDSQLVPFPLTL